jgi:hypothetical protein
MPLTPIWHSVVTAADTGIDRHRYRSTRSDLALCCQSRMAEGGIVPPHSVLAPESALGSVRTVALPSAHVISHCTVSLPLESPS